MKREEKQYKNYTIGKEIAALIDTVQEEFPLAFPQKPDNKVALKIGILDDLIKWGKPLGYSKGKIKRALRAWCQGRRYCEALAADNAVRIDLHGNIAGSVSVDAANVAKKKLQVIEAKRRIREVPQKAEDMAA